MIFFRLLWRFIAGVWGLLIIWGMLAGVNADSAGLLTFLRNNTIIKRIVDHVSTYPLLIPICLGTSWFIWWFIVDIDRAKMELEAKNSRKKRPGQTSRHKLALRKRRSRG